MLLGQRRLRREIDMQSQHLIRDIERVKRTTAQLRHTAVARITSPLGLLGATGAGFIAGKIAGRASSSRRIAQQSISSMTSLTLNTLRAIGLQVVVPMIVEWVQARFSTQYNEATADEKIKSDISL